MKSQGHASQIRARLGGIRGVTAFDKALDQMICGL